MRTSISKISTRAYTENADLDAGKIRTLLKSYNLPMDYRVYFEEDFGGRREINAYRKAHNPSFLRILDSAVGTRRPIGR